MSITIKEKEHWKKCIERRIDHAIDELQAATDPGYTERTIQQAEDQAWSSLGLGSLHEEADENKREQNRLRERLSRIWDEMHDQITGVSGTVRPYRTGLSRDVCEAVKQRQAVLEKELLVADPLGRGILRLRQEKQELLDAVCLATSPSQIEELRSHIAGLLNRKPPSLRQATLSVELPDDPS